MDARQYLVLREHEFGGETVEDLCERYGVSGYYYPVLLGGQGALALRLQEVTPLEPLPLPESLVHLGELVFGQAGWPAAALAAAVAESYQRPVLLVGVVDARSSAYTLELQGTRLLRARAVVDGDRLVEVPRAGEQGSAPWTDGYRALVQAGVGAFLGDSAFPFAFDHLENAYHRTNVVDVGRAH
jgi:hypothetical protein